MANINDRAFRNLPGWLLAAMANDADTAPPAVAADEKPTQRPDFRGGINVETGEMGLMPPAGYDFGWQELPCS